MSVEVVALVIAGVALALQLLSKVAAKTATPVDDAVVKALQDPKVAEAIRQLLSK